jgi:hypothetical protein
MTTSQPSPRMGVTEATLETLLTETDFSRITKRSIASVRRDRLLRQGCPFVKLGALVRYRPEDLRAYISRNLQTVTPTLKPVEQTSESKAD